MKKVVIRTFAFNAERTIERTIQSIMKQTYSNFTWYIINNGSTDSTGDILRKYSREDERLNIIEYKYNRVDTDFTLGVFYDILEKHDDETLFCTIDSDDCYANNFLQEMITFMEENDLEIAACGSYFINDSSQIVEGVRTIEKPIFLEGDNKAELFPEYYQFVRTVWGKLYSFQVLRKCDFSQILKVSYGNDTLFALESFKNAKRIGISNKILHFYFMHNKSVSYTVCDKKRIISPDVIMEQSIKYLSKYGSLTQNNITFLSAVFYNSMKETVELILKSDNSDIEKIHNCYEVFQSRYAVEIIANTHGNIIKDFKENIISWLHKVKIEDIAEEYQKVVYILEILFPNSRGLEHLFVEKSQQYQLLLACKEKDTLSKSYVNEELNKIVNENVFSALIPVDIRNKYQKAIYYILTENYDEAMKQINKVMKIDNVSRREKIQMFSIEEYLAAQMEDQEHYILLKKKLLECLILEEMIQEAEEELDDFDVLLPEDSDFLNYRNKINERKGFQNNLKPGKKNE